MEAGDQSRPSLRELVGALLLASGRVLTTAQVREAMRKAAEAEGRDPEEVSEKEIAAAMREVKARLEQIGVGMEVVEVAQGWRIQTRAACGPWVRALLAKAERPRLSRPALETLAIIAYRQPCTRAEIEAVRGVSVDHVLRNLLEMELIRIAGRSRLPGRPLFFATTGKFLEHFGLRSLDELPAVEELRRREGAAGSSPAAEKAAEGKGKNSDEQSEGAEEIEAGGGSGP